MKYVLGSGSPRRKELLVRVIPSFDVMTADVIESDDEQMGVEGLAIYNAELKARAVSEICSADAVVIGADTVVWLGERAYGKPKSREEAIEMLSSLSGKTHTVGTGVAVMQNSRLTSFCDTTQVSFKEVSLHEIEHYIHTVDVMDKAGSYAIQDGGERIIHRYEGSFENVMGLPVDRLKTHLHSLALL